MRKKNLLLFSYIFFIYLSALFVSYFIFSGYVVPADRTSRQEVNYRLQNSIVGAPGLLSVENRSAIKPKL